MNTTFDHRQDTSIQPVGTFTPNAHEHRLPYEADTQHFSEAVLNSPMFEGKDVAGIIGAAVMTLGPLAAYSLGLGF
ncbi:hypothetical protein [Mesorhizobium sp.]|uniref:hypothetical protein n=1 Tax=Mesorhizobium sp. TaxID=1871066 RepID=UPI003BA9F867